MCCYLFISSGNQATATAPAGSQTKSVQHQKVNNNYFKTTTLLFCPHETKRASRPVTFQTHFFFVLFRESPFDPARPVAGGEVFGLATGRAPEEELLVWLRCETVKRRARTHRATPPPPPPPPPPAAAAPQLRAGDATSAGRYARPGTRPDLSE